MTALATTYIDAGRKPEAVSLYDRMLDEARRLPVEMLSIRLEVLAYVAGVYLGAGKVDQALKLIDEYKAGVDPSDVQSQRFLRVFYIELGNVHRQAGQVSQGLAAYQTALEISQKVVEANPGNAQDKHELFANYHRIAVLQENEKEYDSAIKMYGLSLEVLHELRKQQQLQPTRQPLIGIVETAIQRCQLSQIDRTKK